jgi:hypothetical protein
MLRLPFMILRVIPHVGGILRGEAATDSGARARTSGEELTLADDQAVVAAALTKLKSQDAGFDLAATTRGVVRAREVVDLARQAGDASAAREVMSDGLWRVFVLLLAERKALTPAAAQAWKSGSVMSFLAYRSSGSGRSRPPVMADRLSCA